MSSYALKTKALDSYGAESFSTIEASGPQEARSAAREQIEQWARRHGIVHVEYTLHFGIGVIDNGVLTFAPQIPQPKKVLVTIEVDSKNKLLGLLKSVRDFVDHSNDESDDGVSQVRACVDVRNQLESCLAGLAR